MSVCVLLLPVCCGKTIIDKDGENSIMKSTSSNGFAYSFATIHYDQSNH